MEEQREKREMVGKEAIQTGRGGDPTVGVADDEDETSSVADEGEASSNVIQQTLTASTLISSRQEWLNFISSSAEEKKTRTQAQNQKQRIRKVPKKLRYTEDFKRCYEPNVVAIGPYHNRCKSELLKVEELKPTIAKQFLSQPIQSPVIDASLEKIKPFGKLYDEDLVKHMDEDALARMMFLDGCFILQFIYCIVHYRVEELGMKNCLIDLAQQDLFLLENQLPFQVLKELMSFRRYSFEYWMYMLVDFIYLTTITPFSWKVYDLIEGVEPIHLLDLLRTLLLGIAGKKNENHIPIYEERQEGYLIRGRLFRSVKELTAAGIHLKPARSTGSLRGINFRSYCIYGKLTLPQITINSSTKTMFLNLIAHEVCMDDPNEFGFTSYICFLDSLIDHADDVQELQSADILDNLLGSNEEVATLFNKIADDLMPEVDTYRDVKVRIRDYFRHRGKTKVASWVAEGLRDHFRSPWTSIAVFAAFFAISVSVVQTIYTIWPLPDKCNESICKYLQNITHTRTPEK